MRTIVAALTICLFVLRAEPASAQVGKLGEFLLSAIIHSLVHQGVKSIFETGDESVTPDQLKSILSDKLRAYRVEEIKENVNGLSNQLDIYDATGDDAFRRLTIVDILGRTSNLEASIYQNITKGQFWELFADYLSVMNIRLAFMAERALVDSKGYNGKRILAQQAVSGLRDIREIFEHDFVDHTKFNCVRKHSNINFYNSNGKDIASKYVHGGKMACKTDRKSILQKSRMGALGIFNWPNFDFWKKRRVFKRPGQNRFYYVYKRYSDRDEYWLLGAYGNENHAKKRRIQNSIGNYPNKLGNVKKTIANWWKIAEKSGNHEARNDALVEVVYLLNRIP